MGILIKELKNNLKFIIILLLIHIIVIIFTIFYVIKPYSILSDLLRLIVTLTLFSHPIILAYSYQTKNGSKSIILLNSKHIYKYAFILYKFLAVVSMLLFFSISSVLWNYIFFFKNEIYFMSISENKFEFFVLSSLSNFSIAFVLLGTVSLLEAFKHIIKYYRNAILGIIFLLCLFFYYWIYKIINLIYVLSNNQFLLYRIALGLIFLIIGVIMFEKYGEL